MSKEAMKLALEALELEDMACRYEKEPTPEHIAKAIAAIKEALAQAEFDRVHELLEKDAGIHVSQQAEQEPVAWMNDSTPSGIFARHMEGAKNFGCTIPLYTAPPQRTEPEQEPVAWRYLTRYPSQNVWTYCGSEPETKPEREPLYTTPQPRRKWFGLTPADFDWLEQVFANKVSNDFVFADIVCVISAKLKEKNSL